MNKQSIIKYSILSAVLNINYAKAEEAVQPQVSGSVNNVVASVPSATPSQAYNEGFVCSSYDSLRDDSKDKSWDFGVDVVSTSFFDMQNTEANPGISAAKLNPKKYNPQAFNSFFAAEFSLSKEFFFALQNKLAVSVSRDFGAKELEFSRYYWEGDLGNGMKIKFGKDNGNFGTNLSASDRYSAHQLTFTHKLDNGIKYSVAIEETSKISTKEDDNKDKAYKTMKVGNDTINTVDEDKTTAHWRTSNSLPKLALSANVFYTEDKLFEVGLNTFATYAEYYKSSKQNVESEKNDYKSTFMYAACLTGKYIPMYSEEFFKGEQMVIKAHAKFRNGCVAGYNPEAGGLGSAIDSNVVFINKDTDVEPIKTLGFSLETKYFWYPNLFSSIKGDYLMIVDTDLSAIDKNNAIEDAFKAKVVPIGLQFGQNLALQPGYNFVAKNGFDEMGHRVFLEIGFSI